MMAETLSSLAAGTVLGVSAGFAPGSLLTLVVTQTLRHGIREGVKVATAPLITDLPIILVSLFGLGKASHSDSLLAAISLGGGVYVLYLAYGCLRTGPVNLEETRERPRSLRKGALINALNPHPYLFWATVGGPFVLRSADQGLSAPLLFIFGFYFFLVGSKVFLAILAGKSSVFLTNKGYIRAMRVLGCLLALLAVVLFRDALSFLRADPVLGVTLAFWTSAAVASHSPFPVCSWY